MPAPAICAAPIGSRSTAGGPKSAGLQPTLAHKITQWSMSLPTDVHRYGICSGGGIMEAANRGVGNSHPGADRQFRAAGAGRSLWLGLLDRDHEFQGAAAPWDDRRRRSESLR